MKAFAVGLILATVSFQTIAALQCMQGIEVMVGDEPQKNDKELTVTECGAATAVASTAYLFAVKPNTISFPSGDYKCYHLKYETQEGVNSSSTIIKGCIYNSLNVCDGKFSSSRVNEVFCSQCNLDGCNSGGRLGFQFKLLGLVAILMYLLK